jgi:hypothetical protein
MAIVSVTESHTGRESANGQLGRRVRRRRFIVVTNDAHTSTVFVERAIDPSSGLQIPQPYQTYLTESEFDNGVVVRAVLARNRDETRLVWDVDVEYDSEFEPFENPYTEPPDIRFETEIYEQPLPGRAATFYSTATPSPGSESPEEAGLEALTAWGQGFTTSAGEPFDPPPTMPRARPIVRFIRNQPLFTLADKVKYENSVNKLTWCGLQKRQAWLRSIGVSYHVWKSTTVGVAPIYYARVEYVFALKAETWDLQLLDIGSYYLDYSTGSPIRKSFTVEGTGEPRLGLLKHDAEATKGSKLAAGEDAQFLRWRTFREEDYQPLGINLNLALEHVRTRRRTA